MNKFRVYTGPCIVEEVAARLVDHFNTVTTGTEHVYVLTTKTREQVFEVLTANGQYPGWNLRDVQVL